MNRNRRLTWLCMFGVVAISGTLGGRAVMSTMARRYLGLALDIMEKHSVVRREVDWTRLRAQAHQRADSALTPFQTHDAIRSALSSLGDHHSGLIEPEVVAQLSTLTATDNPRPQGRIVSGRIGYILVAPFVGLSQKAIDDAATSLHRIVREVGMRQPCGWIVDLQNHGGGNMWPGLAGLGSILGEGTLGGFVDPDNVEVQWVYKNGEAFEGTDARSRVVEPVYRSPFAAAPVAVLISRMTASSGEAVAIAFQGRPHTRFFGERTRSLTTSNDQFPLRDGAMLNLSVSRFVDRAGRSYPDGIVPDEPIDGRARGSAQAAAEEWLLNQPSCGGR